ncbi:coiled-coil domain-containing protein 87 [Hemicordylus capensis]|uniref:coiled-coil domain-containing protein 87 n=1 Tax=Hemicordylus capensis TaxID=884348 RepID=UPI002303CCE5|nr:coiled-coil domain-containing protein 87 [Hemicordylus capensis]
MAALRRPLYSLDDTAEPAQQLREQYQRLLAPLSLFPRQARLKHPPARPLAAASASPSGLSSPQKPLPAPVSLATALQLVKGRMELGPEWEHISRQSQRVFQEIILAEVRRVWPDVQQSLYDPVFSAETNRELYQHLLTYICLVCQHLFLHYLCLMEYSHALHVFTDCANLTRFSAQLSLDCSNFLNVKSVRHRLVMEMKTLQSPQPEQSRKHITLEGQLRTCILGGRLGFTISYFIMLLRPQVQTLRQKIAKDIKDLEDLPPLDLSKIKNFIQPTRRAAVFSRRPSCAAITTPCQLYSDGEKTKAGRMRRAGSISLKRTQSLPNMRVGQLLADELGIHLSLKPLSPDLLTRYTEPPEDEQRGLMRLSEDLRRLVQGSVLKSGQGRLELDEESELPPLIKALTLRKTNEVRQQQLERILNSLIQEEAYERKRRNTMILAPATHPQAATVNVKLHNRMVAKAADLQVSERVCLEAVAMNTCPPLYNHLLGEIDNAAIKALDANLSTGAEVKEIYQELMNTIPQDHLKFNLGHLMQHTATNIDLESCFASSTLTRKKCEQVINEELSKILPAGPFSPEEVLDTITTPNLPFKKKSAKKAYASWLRWWRSTFNTDDFLKYISTRESDYLQVIFHLYDCKEMEEEPPVDEVEIRKQVEVKREVLKKAGERQSKEGMYQPGKWNSSIVMVEGLGSFMDSDHRPEDLRTLQKRLERLWTVLHFSEQERLDMAIKYSSGDNYLLLPDMLKAWEMAAQSIQERELLLAELEAFEQIASDPNRLFKRAPRSFALRLKESGTRSRLYYELTHRDSELYLILNQIKMTFNDVVTFKGRPYLEKMEWDTVEMLYWLQQERRAKDLKKFIQRGSRPLKLPSLIPSPSDLPLDNSTREEL